MPDTADQNIGNVSDQRSISSTMLSRLRSHDAQAWENLVALFGPVLYKWCRRAELQPDDAEDISNEVFRVVFVKLNDFHRSRSSGTFRGWLWMITRNKILDHFRRQPNRPQAVGGTEAKMWIDDLVDADVDQVDEHTGFDSRQAIVRGTLDLIRNDFDERTWKAFWLMTVDNRASADVGEELGMKKDAVRQAKRRVLQRLREELDGMI